MLNLIAKWYAKKRYVWAELSQSANLDLNASAAQYKANQRREEVKALTEQADAIEANVKRLDELEEKGYWLCEDGDEKESNGDELAESQRCDVCAKYPMKFIRRDLMTGQEKYESEKERKEAVQMAEANRASIAEIEEQIKGNDD